MTGFQIFFNGFTTKFKLDSMIFNKIVQDLAKSSFNIFFEPSHKLDEENYFDFCSKIFVQHKIIVVNLMSFMHIILIDFSVCL